MPMTRKSALAVTSDSIAETDRGGTAWLNIVFRITALSILFLLMIYIGSMKTVKHLSINTEGLSIQNPKKVIKELEHKGALRSAVQRKVVIVQPPEAHPVRDAAKQAVADVMHEHIRRAVDWALDVGIPYLWHEHVVPFFHQTKEALTSKELKVDAILTETQASADIAVKQQKTGVKMTQEEAGTLKSEKSCIIGSEC